MEPHSAPATKGLDSLSVSADGGAILRLKQLIAHLIEAPPDRDRVVTVIDSAVLEAIGGGRVAETRFRCDQALVEDPLYPSVRGDLLRLYDLFSREPESWNPKVRGELVILMHRLGGEEEALRFRAALRETGDDSFRVQLIRALGHLGGATAATALVEAGVRGDTAPMRLLCVHQLRSVVTEENGDTSIGADEIKDVQGQLDVAERLVSCCRWGEVFDRLPVETHADKYIALEGVLRQRLFWLIGDDDWARVWGASQLLRAQKPSP